MLKHSKGYVVMLVLLSQTLLSITLGLFGLHMFSKGHILPNVYINSLSVGNYTKSKAVSTLKEHYGKLSSYSSLVINYSDDKEYRIKLSDIDFSIDYEATADLAYSFGESSKFARIVKGVFSASSKTVYPIVNLNEEKLEKHLKDFALLVDRPPENAQMHFHNGEINITSHKSGLKLNMTNSVEKIRNEIGSHLDSAIEFKVKNNFEINSVPPDITVSDFKGVHSIISSYSTPIINDELKVSIKQAVKALNGFLLPKSDLDDEKHMEFSFIQRLKQKGVLVEKEDEGYSQVASTLYTALLKTGIDIDFVKRTKHEKPVDYIEYGLDVKISKDGNLSFKNPFDFPIAVFSEWDDKTVTVYVIGNKSSDYSERKIEVNITQRFEPSVLRVVNYDLKPGEERIISSGKQGIEVEVSRVSMKNNKKSSELLYVNKYDAIGSIMQVGPRHKPDNSTDK